MAAQQQKSAMPSPQTPRPNLQPAEAKRRAGGCFKIATQKGRIAEAKAKRSSKPTGGGQPSAMGAIKKLALDVMQITIGIGAFMSSLIDSLFRLGRGYVPVIETAAHISNADAYARVASRPGALPVTPQGFAAAYQAETAGSGGNMAHKREIIAPVPVPKPRIDDSAEVRKIRAKALEDYGTPRAFSALADYFGLALRDPDRAVAGMRSTIAAGSFSEELRTFLAHPNRADVKTIDGRIAAVSVAQNCSREIAVSIVMEDIENAASSKAYAERERAMRLQAMTDEEGGNNPPAAPGHPGL